MGAASTWLSVAEVCALTGRPLRTVQRWLARWEATGLVRVRREPCRGNARGRLLVHGGDLDAVCAGELPDTEAIAA